MITYVTSYVHVRYPTKDWTSLGTLHARDERSVQTFPVQDVAMFSKYLRVDMLSHYGTEHFCPLTVLRSALCVVVVVVVAAAAAAAAVVVVAVAVAAVAIAIKSHMSTFQVKKQQILI